MSQAKGANTRNSWLNANKNKVIASHCSRFAG